MDWRIKSFEDGTAKIYTLGEARQAARDSVKAKKHL